MTDKSDTIDTQSQFREMALKGKQYREEIDFTYYGDSGSLYVRPLIDEEFLPVASMLEERMDMDPEEAQEALEDGRDPDSGVIDASQFDDEFVAIMQRAAAMGIDTTRGIAEGEDEESIINVVKMLQGGKSLDISETVLDISSDPESAKEFRGEGGGS